MTGAKAVPEDARGFDKFTDTQITNAVALAIREGEYEAVHAIIRGVAPSRPALAGNLLDTIDAAIALSRVVPS